MDSNPPAQQGTWTGWGKAQVNTAVLRPSRLWGWLPPRTGWKGPRGGGKGGFNPAHSDMSLTDGKAGPGEEPGPPAVQWADGENLP